MNDHEPCILCDNGEEALCDAREFIRMAERCGEMTPHPPPTPEECEDVKSVQKSSYSTSPFFSNQTGKVGREFIGRLHQIPGADELTRMAQEDGLYGGEE